jgi:radical SAM family uncharacterized protein/radical SAM-linked protein
VNLPAPVGSTEHPYASFVHRVQKPGRYVGGEYGAVRKDWDGVDARVCLAFPDVYDIGMSHLGFKILYRILNDHPRALAERCYTPWVDMQAELRARHVPLVSLESARPLSDFDVVGFSLQFELTYSNILAMLDLGGIPLRAAARGEDEPLILAGGPAATHPEPLAIFLDALVVGDGEERATEAALLWVDLKKRGAPRAARLRALATLPGVYVPSLYATERDAVTGLEVVTRALVAEAPLPVRRTMVESLDAWPFPDDGPVGGTESVFERISIEIARGCTEGCRFCQGGMIYRPVRERDPEAIVETVVRAVRNSGADEVSLTSLSTADYSCIAPLVKKVTDRLVPEKVSLGVSSLRAYGLDENVLDDLTRVRATGITFAPEAGSQRMRDVINKNITLPQILETAERVFSRGWTRMKLYFMIGLPTEDESDVREIVRLGAQVRLVGKTVKRTLREQGKPNGGGAPAVTVSVSTHVPKPHTPFQWCAMDSAEVVRQKQRWLEEERRANNAVLLRVHDSNTSWLEGVFARGDRRLGTVLERAYGAGARFDSWEDQIDIGVWEEAFRAEGVDPKPYLGAIPVGARLPWDHIDIGLADGFLAREHEKAVGGRLSPPCGKPAGVLVQHSNVEDLEADGRKLVCYDCGLGCDLGAMRARRIEGLVKLGASKLRPAPVSPLLAPQPTGEEHADPRRAKVNFSQGRGLRYRFGFTKLGPSALLSHLDVVRALPRSFRRAGIPLFYSTGFHPKPDFTFSPALSLGVSSTCEVADVKLTSEVEAEAVLEALTKASPEGLRFFAGVRLGPKDRAVSRLVDTARYAVAIPASALEALGGRGWLTRRIEEAMAAPELRVKRTVERSVKWVDVREYLRAIGVDSEAARAAALQAGVTGYGVVLAVDLEIRGSGAIKIAEVVEALAGAPDVPHRAVRFAMGTWNAGEVTSPFAFAAPGGAEAQPG